MNLRLLAVAGAIAVSTIATGASAQTIQPPSIAQVRGENGSDRNLRAVRHRLEGMIDQLQRDQRDYGGHRVKAIADLQAAREEIVAALAADKGK